MAVSLFLLENRIGQLIDGKGGKGCFCRIYFLCTFSNNVPFDWVYKIAMMLQFDIYGLHPLF
jgi:hypothetical protein